MVGTILGILVALAVVYHPVLIGDNPDLNVFAFIFALVATSLLLVKHAASIFAWSPIQRAEQEQTSHIFGLFMKDTHLKYVNAWLLFFTIFSFYTAIELTLFNSFNKNYLFAIWIALFGVSLDCLHYFIKRISEYLNPFDVISMLAKDGIKCIQDEREMNLCGNFDALCEMGVKSIDRFSPSLASLSINETQLLAKSFLEASKSIAHPQQDSETQAMGIKDTVSYMLFYLFQRLDLLNEKGLEKRVETVCSDLITALGKITLYAAKYDITMTLHPLHYLNLFAQKAIQKDFRDTALRATFVLTEVAKAIAEEIDLTYLEIRDTYLSLIGHLEAIAKESFKKNKSIKVQLLLQPFLEIRQLFQGDKFVNHPDVPAIIADLDRIILELQTLETVMKTMPPLPNISDLANKTTNN